MLQPAVLFLWHLTDNYFSALGTPLDWPEAKKEASHVRAWGIEQLLALWQRTRGKERDALLWGDEVGGRDGKDKGTTLTAIEIDRIPRRQL